jgi:hypothetical protein
MYAVYITWRTRKMAWEDGGHSSNVEHSEMYSGASTPMLMALSGHTSVRSLAILRPGRGTDDGHKR